MFFVDSDFFIAWNSKMDAHHERAVMIWEEVMNKDEEVVTSWEVVDEVATKLSLFMTREAALDFLKIVFESDFKVEYVTPLLGGRIRDLFRKQTSKRVSMTDCANMVIARELGVGRFLSFDKHYEKNGFKLVGSG